MPVYGLQSGSNTNLERADQHIFTRFRSGDGVSLHPLQRAGVVSAASHGFVGAQRAHGHPGLGDAPPAGHMNMTLPPLVPIVGTPRDPAMMV